MPLHRPTASLLLILLAALTPSSSADDIELSPRIASAKAKCDAAVTQAEETLSRVKLTAKTALFKELDAALKDALDGHHSEDANKITEVRARIAGEISDLTPDKLPPEVTAALPVKWNIRVSSKEGWQAVGRVRVDDKITFVSTGAWALSNIEPSTHTYDADGNRTMIRGASIYGGYDPKFKMGALIGRIVTPDGEEHRFLAGASGTVKAEGSGRLELRVNEADAQTFNNIGEITVAVTRQ
ncbi:MAG: hypothetical protein K8S99_09685 [Planctomycetes bacterium]|nr:hypothetical protein [Planctomycetota bacterium]